MTMTKRSECTCSCHSNPGMLHVVACCEPDEPLITKEWFEKRAALEGDSEIGAGSRKGPRPENVQAVFSAFEAGAIKGPYISALLEYVRKLESRVAPTVAIEKHVSDQFVTTHGGYAQSVTWTLLVNDKVISTETDRWNVNVNEKDMTAPYTIRTTFETLQHALAPVAIGEKQ